MDAAVEIDSEHGTGAFCRNLSHIDKNGSLLCERVSDKVASWAISFTMRRKRLRPAGACVKKWAFFSASSLIIRVRLFSVSV